MSLTCVGVRAEEAYLAASDTQLSARFSAFSRRKECRARDTAPVVVLSARS